MYNVTSFYYEFKPKQMSFFFVCQFNLRDNIYVRELHGRSFNTERGELHGRSFNTERGQEVLERFGEGEGHKDGGGEVGG